MSGRQRRVRNFRAETPAAFATSATASQINSAIDSCPSNQVITLDSGTFSLTSDIELDKSGVVLRGATNANGTPATTLRRTSTDGNPFINIGVNLGALPTKGLTLPFMSYGGSAILLNLIALAIVMLVDYENRQMMKGARS